MKWNYFSRKIWKLALHVLLLLTKIALVNNSRNSSRVGSGLDILKPNIFFAFLCHGAMLFKVEYNEWNFCLMWEKIFLKRSQTCQFYCYHPSPPLLNPSPPLLIRICTNFKFGLIWPSISHKALQAARSFFSAILAKTRYFRNYYQNNLFESDYIYLVSPTFLNCDVKYNTSPLNLCYYFFPRWPNG